MIGRPPFRWWFGAPFGYFNEGVQLLHLAGIKYLHGARGSVLQLTSQAPEVETRMSP